MALYVRQHREEPSVVAVAQLLSTILYSRRFFPYYTFNVLFGIDQEGQIHHQTDRHGDRDRGLETERHRETQAETDRETQAETDREKDKRNAP